MVVAAYDPRDRSSARQKVARAIQKEKGYVRHRAFFRCAGEPAAAAADLGPDHANTDSASDGKHVNSALDSAINYFTAQGLDNRTNSLSSLLDSMSNGINTIQAANNGISSITKLVQSAQALVSQAQQAGSTATQATLSTQFNSLLSQISQLAGDRISTASTCSAAAP